jgi:hypothetical protein
MNILRRKPQKLFMYFTLDIFAEGLKSQTPSLATRAIDLLIEMWQRINLSLRDVKAILNMVIQALFFVDKGMTMDWALNCIAFLKNVGGQHEELGLSAVVNAICGYLTEVVHVSSVNVEAMRRAVLQLTNSSDSREEARVVLESIFQEIRGG